MKIIVYSLRVQKLCAIWRYESSEDIPFKRVHSINCGIHRCSWKYLNPRQAFGRSQQYHGIRASPNTLYSFHLSFQFLLHFKLALNFLEEISRLNSESCGRASASAGSSQNYHATNDQCRHHAEKNSAIREKITEFTRHCSIGSDQPNSLSALS